MSDPGTIPTYCAGCDVELVRHFYGYWIDSEHYTATCPNGELHTVK